MSESLGRRQIEPPLGADMGAWAAGEVSKHEELCGLRYEAIAKDAAAMLKRVEAIEGRIAAGVRWVMGIVASLAVALIVMFLNNAHAQSAADEADRREMRARLSLLTAQLANVQPHGTVVVAPPGSQTTTVPPATDPSIPIDPDDLSAAAGGKPGK